MDYTCNLKLQKIVCLFAIIVVFIDAKASDDCVTEQVACSNRCLERNDTECIHDCSDQATACIKKFVSVNGGDGKMVDNLLNRLPPGTYASWSADDKQRAALALNNICDHQCRQYTLQAEKGSMRASYEAAACTQACYVNHLPIDYPQMEEYKQAARQNYKSAKELGSNAPVFLSQ
jgi:hypothetical protein